MMKKGVYFGDEIYIEYIILVQDEGDTDAR